MTNRKNVDGKIKKYIDNLFTDVGPSQQLFDLKEEQAFKEAVISMGDLRGLVDDMRKKYAMNKIRAALYAVAIGLTLFGFFAGITAGYATGEAFIAVGSIMVFVLAGVGLFLFLFIIGLRIITVMYFIS